MPGGQRASHVESSTTGCSAMFDRMPTAGCGGRGAGVPAGPPAAYGGPPPAGLGRRRARRPPCGGPLGAGDAGRGGPAAPARPARRAAHTPSPTAAGWENPWSTERPRPAGRVVPEGRTPRPKSTPYDAVGAARRSARPASAHRGASQANDGEPVRPLRAPAHRPSVQDAPGPTRPGAVRTVSPPPGCRPAPAEPVVGAERVGRPIPRVGRTEGPGSRPVPTPPPPRSRPVPARFPAGRSWPESAVPRTGTRRPGGRRRPALGPAASCLAPPSGRCGRSCGHGSCRRPAWWCCRRPR